MPTEDIVFLVFVWLCLAGPLILMGIGILLRVEGLMSLAMMLTSLISVLDHTNHTGGDTAQPKTRPGRWVLGGILIVLGLAVGWFFQGAVT
ncbi:MAG: hypothetical protein AAF125_12435 [Chloroflexota bacterium]